jgi:hypothetical protein
MWCAPVHTYTKASDQSPGFPPCKAP